MTDAAEATPRKRGATLVAPMFIGLIGTSFLFLFIGIVAAAFEARNRGYSPTVGVIVAVAAYVIYIALAAYFFRAGRYGWALVVAWAPVTLIFVGVKIAQWLDPWRPSIL